MEFTLLNQKIGHQHQNNPKKPMGNASCQCSMLSMVPQIELHLSNSGRNQEGVNAEGFSRHLNLCTFLSVSVTHKFVLHSSKQITLLS